MSLEEYENVTSTKGWGDELLKQEKARAKRRAERRTSPLSTKAAVVNNGTITTGASQPSDITEGWRCAECGEVYAASASPGGKIDGKSYCVHCFERVLQQVSYRPEAISTNEREQESKTKIIELLKEVYNVSQISEEAIIKLENLVKRKDLRITYGVVYQVLEYAYKIKGVEFPPMEYGVGHIYLSFVKEALEYSRTQEDIKAYNKQFEFEDKVVTVKLRARQHSYRKPTTKIEDL